MLSLVADYSDSSNSSSSEEPFKIAENEIAIKDSKELKQRLPSAEALLAGTNGKKIREVFSNPYLEAENAKTALLEKHVKMVNKDEHLTEKNGRKICWNYRKGRCRFGSNCHYAHDSDLSSSSKNSPQHSASTKANKDAPMLGQFKNASGDDGQGMSTKKRKRPGLSDSIEPGKRVIKAYQQQLQSKKHKS